MKFAHLCTTTSIGATERPLLQVCCRWRAQPVPSGAPVELTGGTLPRWMNGRNCVDSIGRPSCDGCLPRRSSRSHPRVPVWPSRPLRLLRGETGTSRPSEKSRHPPRHGFPSRREGPEIRAGRSLCDRATAYCSSISPVDDHLFGAITLPTVQLWPLLDRPTSSSNGQAATLTNINAQAGRRTILQLRRSVRRLPAMGLPIASASSESWG